MEYLLNRTQKRRQQKLSKKTQRLASASGQPGVNAPEIQQSLDLAVQHHTAGRLREAESIYQRVLDANPDQPDALHLLGVIAVQYRKYDIAVDLITQALTIKPDYAEAYNNLGYALGNIGRLDEAVASYHKSLAIKPDYSEAHNNLGNSLQDLGRLDEAVASYHNALAIKPHYAEAHYGLGVALNELGRMDEAVVSCQNALAIKSDYAEAHCNIGNASMGLDKLEEAVESFRMAVAINPNFAEARTNLGYVLQKLERFEDAISNYDRAALPKSRARTLECLYAQGRYEEFYLRLERFMEVENTNLGVAAISAFVSHQLGRENPYPFCKAPLDFIRVGQVSNHAENTDKLIDVLVEELGHRIAIWEPQGVTTRNGYQSRDNLFLEPYGGLVELDRIIKAEINSYYIAYKSASCSFIESWPSKISLNGWFVRLLTGGHQTNHYHPGGWLSGVVYLKLPNKPKRNEGSIEFGLCGLDYTILDSDYPRTLHRPEVGEIVMFPSSLFHKTLPFRTDDDRLSISFDLLPD